MKRTDNRFRAACLGAALMLSGALAASAAVDKNFTHGEDIYTYANPQGPGTYVNSDAYLRTYSLQGTTTRRSEWLQMNTGNYYAHPGYGYTNWQWALPPNTTYFTTGTSARLYKGTLSNPTMMQYGNPGGTGGLYTGMTRTSFLLWEEAPVADLHTVIFQAYLTTGSEPGLTTEPYQDVNGDFYVAGGGLPALTLFFADGSTQKFTAQDSTAELYESRETVFGHTEELDADLNIYENYRSYRWDLNNLGLVASDIVRFGIEFTLEAHVAFRSMSLDQAGGMIPEPGHLALLLGFSLTAVTLLRRRKCAAQLPYTGTRH